MFGTSSGRARLVVAVIVVIALLGACSVRQELTLRQDGSGEALVTVDVHPLMLSYVNDLFTALTGVAEEHPVFDVDQIAATFEQRREIDLVRVERLDRGRLEMVMRFADINAAFAEEGSADVVSFTRQGANRELVVRLDRQAVNRFLGFAPPESAAMTQFLFPPADGSVSAAEYREELAWALEEYADRAEVLRVLDAAAIEVVVRPTGRIVRQTGGVIRDGAVIFSIPILEVLTLDRSRTYSVVFTP